MMNCSWFVSDLFWRPLEWDGRRYYFPCRGRMSSVTLIRTALQPSSLTIAHPCARSRAQDRPYYLAFCDLSPALFFDQRASFIILACFLRARVPTGAQRLRANSCAARFLEVVIISKRSKPIIFRKDVDNALALSRLFPKVRVAL